MPKSIVSLVEALTQMLAAGAAGSAPRDADWLSNLPVDVDGVAIAYSMHDWLLTDTRIGLLSVTKSPHMRLIIAMIAELSRRGRAGDPPAAEAWKSVRKQAVEVTNAVPEGDERAYLLSVIENAAWSPATSATVLSSMYRSLGMIHAHSVAQKMPQGADVQEIRRATLHRFSEQCFEALLHFSRTAPVHLH